MSLTCTGRGGGTSGGHRPTSGRVAAVTRRPFGTKRGGPGPDPGSEPDPIRALVDEPPTSTAHRIGSQVIMLVLAVVLIVVLVVSGEDQHHNEDHG